MPAGAFLRKEECLIMTQKCGRQVYRIPTSDKNRRNSEGAFVRLKNGAILFAYSRFGFSSEDDGSSDIYGITSYDDGDTWGNNHLILTPDGNSDNIMCPSFIRMQNGDLGMIYVQKCRGIIEDVIRIVRSSNEGETWSDPIDCTPEHNYFVFENGHAIRQHNGRILIPMSYHRLDDQPLDGYNYITLPFSKGYLSSSGEMAFTVSDDDGVTWSMLPARVRSPFSPTVSPSGLQETTVYEEMNGRLRAFARTDLGFQFESISDDNGKTWSDAMPNRFFSSPLSPMLIKRVSNLTLAVFNPIPNYLGREISHNQGRTPLVCAVSHNDGKSIDSVFMIDDSDRPLCYPDIFDGGDFVLIGYADINDSVIHKIMLSELT